MKLMVQFGTKKMKMDIEEGMTLGIFKYLLSEQFGIEQDLIVLSVLNKHINAFDDETVESVGIKNMTMVRVLLLNDLEKSVKQGTGHDGYIPLIDKTKFVTVRRPMPGDNSCLFHCLEYLFYNKSTQDPSHIRKEVAEIVKLYPQKFTTDYLGQPNSLYCLNIVEPNTWGSNVEISIYSFLKECQIIVFDLENNLDVTYGEKSLNRCAFIIFTGNHFDVLCLTQSLTSPPSEDKVLFNNTDKSVKDKMKSYIQSEHPNFRFTF
ncbi:hypothetical protein EIN_410960 [Entamoeba invadens IP1]|uniref:Ubiquitin thioesterase OTU n=1 Tax=Entamoeba invadens IP1 TaxID=370355 RepID=A0A0A1U134_ENTIV|nr:hypothetical protein EIN_410960 [Entamoeba invadens IP1]ELP87743.1 hypothetical protein EIN_410960 [Entamoeba invadens IP1]|eukprot:XP_004254514.1 hypothetical protein EIN_410960 [Entamoeba invadens IP1]